MLWLADLKKHVICAGKWLRLIFKQSFITSLKNKTWVLTCISFRRIYILAIFFFSFIPLLGYLSGWSIRNLLHFVAFGYANHARMGLVSVISYYFIVYLSHYDGNILMSFHESTAGCRSVKAYFLSATVRCSRLSEWYYFTRLVTCTGQKFDLSFKRN